MSTKDQTLGLYQKYHVERTDGRKHESGDKFFVLNYAHAADRLALETFADAIQSTHPLLARDIYRELFGPASGLGGMAGQAELPFPNTGLREGVEVLT